MEQSNGLGNARIALLIDFDNVILGIDDPGFDVELVVNALRERGTIVVSRVYGDWFRHNRHRRKLMEHGLELVEAPAFGPVIKNSADIKIALDGYEIGMTMPHINTFCLVSGDSDFLPLIKKLQGLGKNVLVICGNRFTSDMLRRNCNEFISYENLLAASYGADEDATTLEGAFALLHRAMEALRERGSEIRTSTLKQMMIQLNPVFSEKTFGYSQFRGFLDKAGRESLIKLGPRDRVSGEFYVLLPEEDEAEVIDKVERAEPAEVVEKLVEARGGRRGRASERNGSERNEERDDRSNNRRRDDRSETKSSRGEKEEKEEVIEETRPRSRREARIAAAQAQANAERNEAREEEAPLATPLTPATDFSPADAQESQELSVSRGELLSRGLRRGRRVFSGKTGRSETVEVATAEAAPVENQGIEPDIALVPDDASTDAAPESAAPQTAPEEATLEAAPTPELSAPEDAPAPAALETPAAETLPASEEARGETENVTASEAQTEIEAAPEAETEKPKRTRSRRRKKTDAPEAESGDGEEASQDALAEEKPKRTRTRRRKKTESPEEPAEDSPENAENSAEEKPKRRRRTSRKKAEEAAEAQAQVSENIVTGDQTTGEVTQEELAQIPVPHSEDEL